MTLEKTIKNFKEWTNSCEKATNGISEYEADKFMKSKSDSCRIPLERDRLIYGEPEVAMILLPYYLVKGIYKLGRNIYNKCKKIN
jgi:hypothetical protein